MSPKTLKVDMAVIGAGSGGLSVAAGAAQLGLKVVLFEKGEMGGDCLNYGCVPSKALIAAAGAAHEARAAGALGVSTGAVTVDFPKVMAHVHAAIAAIAPNDSQSRFEGFGVQVVREAARFIDDRTLASDSVRVRARKIVVATGSHAAVPPIPGLDAFPYLTNETLFGLTELPKRLIVLGGGPIGVELGQAFRRLGSEVVLTVACDGETRKVTGTHLLIAVGRKPSLDGLELDKAGVTTDRNGIVTDTSLRSSNKRVYAVGDAAGRGQFTHLAGAHASLLVRRAVFALPVNADTLQVPRVTYCDPELAAIGLGEVEARKTHGDDIRVETFDFAENDRAIAEGDTRGFGKLITTTKGKVLGVTLVGRHAGDHIHLWSLVLSAGLKLSQLTSMIAPYPTRGEIGKRLAGQWYTPALFSDRTRALVSVLKRFA